MAKKTCGDVLIAHLRAPDLATFGSCIFHYRPHPCFNHGKLKLAEYTRHLQESLAHWVCLPATALCALVLKTGIWPIALAMQTECVVKVPVCIYRIRTRRWIHDVTVSRREEP